MNLFLGLGVSRRRKTLGVVIPPVEPPPVVVPAIPVPTGFTATVLSSSSIKYDWTAPGTPPAGGYRVYGRRTSAGETVYYQLGAVAAGVTTLTVLDLPATTTVQAYAVSVVAGDISDPSNIVSAATQAAPAPPQTSQQSLGFYGEDTSTKEQGFYAQVLDEDGVTWNTVATVESGVGAGMPLYVVVPGFDANKRETTRLVAYNASGISINAAEMEVVTPPIVPVTNVFATALSWHEVQITFVEPAVADRPIEGGYEVAISRNGGVSFDEAYPDLAMTGTGGILLENVSEGLETLHFKVRPVASLDTGLYGEAWSNVASASLPEHILDIDQWAETFGEQYVHAYALNEPLGAVEATDALGLRPGAYLNVATTTMQAGPPGMPGQTAARCSDGALMYGGTGNLGCGLAQADYNAQYSAMVAFKTSNTTVSRRLFSVGSSGNTGYGFQIRAGASVASRPALLFFNYAGTLIATIDSPSGTNMSDNQWHTTGMVYNNGRIGFFFDGVEVGFANITPQEYDQGFLYARLRLGAQAHSSVSSTWLAAAFSRMKLFTLALSAEQMATAHYKYMNPVPVI